MAKVSFTQCVANIRNCGSEWDWPLECSEAVGYCERAYSIFGFRPQACKTQYRWLAGGSGPLDMDGVPESISGVNEGLDIACSDKQYYSDNPRVCRAFCNPHDTSAEAGKRKCRDTAKLTYKSESEATGISIKTPGGAFTCDLPKNYGAAQCNLASKCSNADIWNDPYAVYPCTSYCLASTENAASCKLDSICSGNFTSSVCEKYCANADLDYPCDTRLSIYCIKEENMEKPICKAYFLRNQDIHYDLMKSRALSDIMNPKSRDACNREWTITSKTGTTVTKQTFRTECDEAARIQCAIIKNKLADAKLEYPRDYANVDALKAAGIKQTDLDFCACFMSPMGAYGQTACMDTACQKNGYQTSGMQDIVTKGQCAPCVQIVAGGGQFWSINGVTQQMTCNVSANDPAGQYKDIDSNVALMADLYIRWRVLGSSSVPTTIPTIDTIERLSIIVTPSKHVPTEAAFASYIARNRKNVWINIINAVAEFNYNTRGSPSSFDSADALVFINLLKNNSRYSYLHNDLVTQYRAYSPTDISNVYVAGSGVGYTARGEFALKSIYDVIRSLNPPLAQTPPTTTTQNTSGASSDGASSDGASSAGTPNGRDMNTPIDPYDLSSLRAPTNDGLDTKPPSTTTGASTSSSYTGGTTTTSTGPTNPETKVTGSTTTSSASNESGSLVQDRDTYVQNPADDGAPADKEDDAPADDEPPEKSTGWGTYLAIILLILAIAIGGYFLYRRFSSRDSYQQDPQQYQQQQYQQQYQQDPQQYQQQQYQQDPQQYQQQQYQYTQQYPPQNMSN